MVCFYPFSYQSALYAQCGSYDFKADIVKGCSPLAVNFKAIKAPAGSSYTWNFGSGGISASDSLPYVFTSGGKRTVTLTISGSSFSTPCIITKVDMINVIASPTPSISVSPGRVMCNGSKPVTFTDNTPNVSYRVWSINGDTFNDPSVSYTFSGSGYKGLSLKVKDNTGCAGYFIDNKYMQVYDSLAFDFCADITSTDTGFTTSFNTPIIINQGLRIVNKYTWTFAGGNPSSYVGKTPPLVNFANKKTANDVTLVVTTSEGCNYVLNRKGFVEPFIKAPDSVCVGTDFNITNLAGRGRTNFQYNLPFASVTPFTETVLKYTKAGTYDFNYQFQYGKKAACQSSFTWPKYVAIKGPSADFSSPTKNLCNITDTVILENKSLEFGAKNVQYTWEFLDTLNKVVKKIGPMGFSDVRVVMGTEGLFTIRLTATSLTPNGCTSVNTRNAYIIIRQPHLNFTADKQVFCLGQTVSLTALTTPKADEKAGYVYSWVIRNSDSAAMYYVSTGHQTNFQPLFPAQYDVICVLVNGKCRDSLVKKRFLTCSGFYTDFSVDTSTGCPNPRFKASFAMSKKYSAYPKGKTPGDYLYRWHANPTEQVDMTSEYSSSTDMYFTNPGCYDITLDIIDPQSKCTSQVVKQQFVCVGLSLGAQISAIKCLGDTSTVFNFSEPGVEHYKWDVSPAKAAIIYPSDTIRSPKFIFLKNTNYVINLIGSKHIRGKLCNSVFTININPKLPLATFSTNDTLMYCAPGLVRFTIDTLGIKQSFWDFGDGNTLLTNSPTVIHIYTSNSNEGYTVKVTAVNAFGCTDTSVKKNYIKILGPQPKFQVEQNKGCDSVTLTFHNLSKNIKQFKLYFDDGSPVDTHSVVKHTYKINSLNKDSFVYNPVMVASDSTGCISYFEYPITMYHSPHADFTADKLLGCVPMTVNFNNLSVSSKGFAWDFDGDGKFDDSSKNASFTYKKPGTYTVKMVALSGGYCNDTMVKTAYIKVLPLPISDFTISEKRFCNKKTVIFKPIGKYYVNYTLDYGDGTPLDSNQVQPHLYYFDGNQTKTDSMIFYPKLTVYSIAGCIDIKTDTVVVYAKPNVAFGSDIKSGCPALAVQFVDSSTYANRWEWDFDNDGKTDFVGQNPLWSFGTGVYSVKLTAYNRHGCSDTLVKVHFIRVNAKPKAGFGVADSDACLHRPVHFTDWSSPATNIRKWAWAFNDKSGQSDSSFTQSPDYSFIKPGIHQIFLAIEDDKGCKDTVIKPAIFVEDSLPPKNTYIRAVSVDDLGNVNIQWRKNKITDFSRYRLKRDDIGVVDSSYFAADTTYIDTDAKAGTGNMSYCYRLQTVDNCENHSIDTAHHCTILLSVKTDNKENANLKWTAYKGWAPIKYYIFRKFNGSSVWTLLNSVPVTTLNYTDSNLCEENYCYKVMALNQKNADTSYSNTICVSPNYQHHDIPLMRYATVENNSYVNIFWAPDTITRSFNTYHIDRYNIQDGWKISYGTTRQNYFTDKNVDVFNSNYMYRVRTQDNCGYTTAYSNLASSLNLRSKIVNDEVVLYWNRYRQWIYGVGEYKVQVKQKDGSFKTIAMAKGNDSTYTDHNVYPNIDTAYCYRLVAIEDEPVEHPDSSISNTACTFLRARIYAPNAFTPNTDQLNDQWKVSALSVYNLVGSPLKDFHVQIFNRWGIQVWQSDNIYAGWDGTYLGKLAPQDVYVYIINAQGMDGKNLHMKGNITLIR